MLEHHFITYFDFHQDCKSIGLTPVEPDPCLHGTVWHAVDFAPYRGRPLPDSIPKLVIFDSETGKFTFNINHKQPMPSLLRQMGLCSRLMTLAYQGRLAQPCQVQ